MFIIVLLCDGFMSKSLRKKKVGEGEEEDENWFYKSGGHGWAVVVVMTVTSSGARAVAAPVATLLSTNDGRTRAK